MMRARRRQLPLLLVAAYACLQVSVIVHVVEPPHGIVAEVMLVLTILATFLAMGCVGAEGVDGPLPAPRWDWPLLLLLTTLWSGLGLQIGFGADIGDRQPPVRLLAAITFAAGLVATAPFFAFVPPQSQYPWLGWLRRWPASAAVLVLAGSGYALKVAGIVFEPHPAIDVWEMLEEGAQALWLGRNPYDAVLENTATLGASFGNPSTSYAYTPSTLLLTLPVVKLLGDVRFLYVLSDAISVWLLLRLDRVGAHAPRLRRYLEIAALLIVFHPRSLAKTWTDPLAIPFLLLAVTAALRERHSRATSIATGLLLSMKQYLVFVAPFFLAQSRRWTQVVLTLTAATASAVPFLIWNPGALWRSSVAFHFRTPFRDDGLTFATLLEHTVGWSIPGWIGPAAATLLVAVGSTRVRRRGMTGATCWSAATCLALFAGSRVAFPNYYHAVMGMLVVAAVLALRENEHGPLPGA